MSWQSIDFFDLEPSWFAEEIHKVVPGFLRDGQESINSVEQQIEAEIEKIRSEAKDEEEGSFARDLRYHELTFLEKRNSLLGAAALHYVYESLKLKLREIARYLDQSRPPSPPYVGKSELLRLKDEFLKRFGLDFEKYPNGFERIEELALARNGLIHGDLREYGERIKSPRIIQNGEFVMEKSEELISDVVGFVAWVVEELRRIRRAATNSKGSKT